MAELVEHNDQYSLSTWRDVLFTIWHTTPTAPAVARITMAIAHFASLHPKGVNIFVVITPGCGVPDAAARDAFARGMKTNDEHTRSSVLVHEGTGFLAATIRAVSVGLTPFVRKGSAMKMFATVGEATAWLAKLGIESVSRPAEVAAAVAEARRGR